VRVLLRSPGRKALLIVLPLLGACASAHRGPGLVGPTDNRVSEGTSPHIMLLEQPPRVDRVVDAAFQVDGDGYALVVAVDLDQQVHVVFPDSPTSDGFVTPQARHLVTPFFAGSGNGIYHAGLFDAVYPGYRHTFFPYQPRLSRHQGAVYLVAIVSGQPLQLDRLRDANGGWATGTLRSAVFDSYSPFVGPQLGHLVTLPDQQFSTDYRIIAAGRSSPLYASSYYGGCGGGAFGVDPFAPRGALLVAQLGEGGLPLGAYPLGSVCGPVYPLDAPGTFERRPPALFPRDTALVFTTRRIALRRPGAGGAATPGFFPSAGDPGRGAQDLARVGGIIARAGEQANSEPAAAPRGEGHHEAERPRPTAPPGPSGHRR
jgi:hypothetical protein